MPDLKPVLGYLSVLGVFIPHAQSRPLSPQVPPNSTELEVLNHPCPPHDAPLPCPRLPLERRPIPLADEPRKLLTVGRRLELRGPLRDDDTRGVDIYRGDKSDDHVSVSRQVGVGDRGALDMAEWATEFMVEVLAHADEAAIDRSVHVVVVPGDREWPGGVPFLES